MIPAEAVEAAAIAWVGEQVWQDCNEAWRADYLERAQVFLEAAAPYMLAAAWKEAIEAYKAWTWDDENMDPLANPYMLNNEGEK